MIWFITRTINNYLSYILFLVISVDTPACSFLHKIFFIRVVLGNYVGDSHLIYVSDGQLHSTYVIGSAERVQHFFHIKMFDLYCRYYYGIDKLTGNNEILYENQQFSSGPTEQN
jgi:hypothetical protein